MEISPTNTSSPSPQITTDPDNKVLSDLSAVSEKITLCQSMLVNIQTTSEIDSHESLLTVIGFLEACVPRVRELINVGMTCLKEETLTKCFQVNDELCKILEDVEHPERVTADTIVVKNDETTEGNGEAKASASGGGDDVTDFLNSLDFDSFGFEEQKQAVGGGEMSASSLDVKPCATATPSASVSATASSTLEDLLAPPSSAPPPPLPSSDVKNDGDDEFDDFFDKRAVKNSFSIDE